MVGLDIIPQQLNLRGHGTGRHHQQSAPLLGTAQKMARRSVSLRANKPQGEQAVRE